LRACTPPYPAPLGNRHLTKKKDSTAFFFTRCGLLQRDGAASSPYHALLRAPLPPLRAAQRGRPPNFTVPCHALSSAAPMLGSPKRRRSCLLPGHAIILSRRPARTGCLPALHYVVWKKGENTYCKPMFQVFQMFHMYIASVLCGCCKSRSGCCICCKCFGGMLQAFVQNV
jgi:hypothetical protein